MYKYYIPFYYLILSRLKSKVDRVSWIIIFIIPPFIMGIFFSTIHVFNYLLIFLIANIAFYSLYEIGYLENDIQTTKKEENPTIRINKAVQEYLEKNYLKVIIFKYTTVFILICSLILLLNDIQKIFSFITILLISRFSFYMHNTIRNKINIVTFFILAITKYSMVLFLLLPLNKLLIPILLSIVTFPLLRTMEHASRKKYNLSKYSQLIGNHDLFRIKYYLLFMLLSSFFIYLHPSNVLLLSIGLYFYFFIFRYASYLLIKKKIYKRDTLKTKDILGGSE